jgi:hypothetical protein
MRTPAVNVLQDAILILTGNWSFLSLSVYLALPVLYKCNSFLTVTGSSRFFKIQNGFNNR